MSARKGFIGPLGDDFPAIFPIAVGLMFFFGAIAVAYDAYYFKETRSTLMRANIMISRSVRQQAAMTSEYWFDVSCPLITEVQANYGVHSALELVRPRYEEEAKEPSGEVRGESTPVEFGNRKARCPAGNDYDSWVEDNDIPFTDPSRTLLTLSYPTIVDMKWQGNRYQECSPDDVGCEQKAAVLVVYTWQ